MEVARQILGRQKSSTRSELEQLLSALRVYELRVFLREYGLPVSGVKADLIRRLVENWERDSFQRYTEPIVPNTSAFTFIPEGITLFQTSPARMNEVATRAPVNGVASGGQGNVAPAPVPIADVIGPSATGLQTNRCLFPAVSVNSLIRVPAPATTIHSTTALLSTWHQNVSVSVPSNATLGVQPTAPDLSKRSTPLHSANETSTVSYNIPTAGSSILGFSSPISVSTAQPDIPKLVTQTVPSNTAATNIFGNCSLGFASLTSGADSKAVSTVQSGLLPAASCIVGQPCTGGFSLGLRSPLSPQQAFQVPSTKFTLADGSTYEKYCFPKRITQNVDEGTEVRFLCRYASTSIDILNLQPGDSITVKDWNNEENWGLGKKGEKVGLFPKEFCTFPEENKHEPTAGYRESPNSFEAGYRNKDYCFTKKPEDWFTCLICHGLADSPHQTTCCGQAFCSGCILKWKKKKNICPLCTVSGVNTSKDVRLDRQIKGLILFCPNYKFGCDWTGELRDVEKHIQESCSYQSIVCPHGCGREIFKHQRSAHDASCPKYPAYCRLCNAHNEGGLGLSALNRKAITTSHGQYCNKWPVLCPNKCDDWLKLKRSELHTHLADSCPEARVTCMFQKQGCTKNMKRKEMAKHIEENLLDHFILLKVDNDDLRSTVEKLQAQVETLTKKRTL